MKYDLETLKQIKFMFGLHSDGSTMCNGYHSLCDMIDNPKKYKIEPSPSGSEALPSSTPQSVEEREWQNKTDMLHDQLLQWTKNCNETQSQLLKAQKEVEELKDLLRDIDKSLYIGKDLDDTEILKWYLDVCQTIKESIQEKLNSEPKEKRSVARDDDSSTKAD